MSDSKKSYRQVLKSTSLFGGVQVFNIFISLIRSKAIALLIGPTGMGIASLLTSTMNLVDGFTNFGLENSAVKVISLANNKEESSKVSRLISVLKQLVWYTITFGVIIMIVLAPQLSDFAFGNKDYTLSLRWVSIALLFKQLSSSQLAILQGLRKLKSLAKANVYGNLLGLIITIPLYYFFRIDAIVPAIIIATFMSFIFTFYYTKELRITNEKLTVKEVFKEGNEMIHLGFMLSLSGLITLLVAYLLQIFISSSGGVKEVGFYNAGFLILNSYVGIIFKAMGTDYFPRLSAISDVIEKIRKAVYEQALVAVLLITPIIILFLTFASLIINILYTKEFSVIEKMVGWGILGMLFKAVSWSMGYMIIAKGDSKVFIKTSIGFNSLLLILNIAGYTYGGLEGLGISFFAYYIIHFIGVKLITFYRYNFYFEKGFYPIFLFSVLLCVLSFLLSYLSNNYIRYSVMIVMSIVAIVYSYIQLDKKIGLKEFLKNLLKKNK